MYVLSDVLEQDILDAAQIESAWLLIVFTPQSHRAIHVVKRLIERLTLQPDNTIQLFFVIIDRAGWRWWYTRIFEYWWYEFRHIITKRDPDTVTMLWSSDVEEIVSGVLGISGNEENQARTTPKQEGLDTDSGSVDSLETLIEEKDAADDHRPSLSSVLSSVREATHQSNDVASIATSNADSVGAGSLFRVSYVEKYRSDEWATLLVSARATAGSIHLQPRPPIHVIPSLPGFRFNPPVVSLTWEEDESLVVFQFRKVHGVPADEPATPAMGHISFFMGPILIGVVDLSIQEVVSSPVSPDDMREIEVRPFESVFISYAPTDTKIANAVEWVAKILDAPYLRQVQQQRLKQKWSPELLSFIDHADVFQLCWSKAARRSKNVKQEVQYALRLARGAAFIRPCYWEDPLPSVPAELSAEQFVFLDTNIVGGYQDSTLQRAWEQVPRTEPDE